jgi:hypothetical protein
MYKSSFWKNFALTSPETLYTKHAVNELSFLVVTHTTCFDIRFDRYEFLKLGFSVGQILDRLVYRGLVRFLGHEMGETCWVRNTRSEAHLLSFSTPTQTHVSDVHSHGYGISVQPRAELAVCGKIGLSNGLEPLARLQTAVRL